MSKKLKRKKYNRVQLKSLAIGMYIMASLGAFGYTYVGVFGSPLPEPSYKEASYTEPDRSQIKAAYAEGLKGDYTPRAPLDTAMLADGVQIPYEPKGDAWRTKKR